MQNFVILLGLIFINNIFVTEGRVFCQDSNAKPWTPVGYTCPVICASVLDAINKLKMMDYEKSVKEQFGGQGYEDDDTEDLVSVHRQLRIKPLAEDQHDKGDHFNKNHKLKIDNIGKYNEYKIEGLSNSDLGVNKYNNIAENVEYFDETHNNKLKNTDVTEDNGYIKNKSVNTEKTISHIDDNNENVKYKYVQGPHINKEHYKIIENVKYVKGILRRTPSHSQIQINTTKYDVNDIKYKENDKCWFLEKFKQKLLIGKVVRRKCTRRSNFDAKFVSVMTNVLNKYVDTVFKFTDEMTELLLENIFGKNTDLRNNIFDVNKLLNYLRKSVDKHKIHSDKHVITLKPKHCWTVAMPGCFCKPGFVESSGQCVKPEDCVKNKDDLKYLTRIIVM